MLIAVSAALLAATYVGYPLWLFRRARKRPRPPAGAPHADWPTITIVVVVRNAEASLRDLLRNLLALAYPVNRRRILVVSNGSTDFTDAVASSVDGEGVQLLRVLRARRSVAAAENLARRHVQSDLVVVVHPDARLKPSALAALVAPFSDPTVAVAYGREVGEEGAGRAGRAAGAAGAAGAGAEPTRFARFEERLRAAESRVFGTVSARRALYALRAELYRAPVAAILSPDFAPILLAREQGYRAVYVRDAVCEVARPGSLKGSYGRTVRTVKRDVATLLMKPHLLDPRRYGAFAGILLGHKLGRWLAPWAAAGLLAGVVLLAPADVWARWALGLALLAVLVTLAPWALRGGASSGRRPPPSPLRMAASAIAVAHAGLDALRELPMLSPARAGPPPVRAPL